MVLASHSVYLKFFLDRGINTFTWNYRGYGRSKGKHNPDSFNEDIQTVIKYIRNDLGLTGKIGVYGRSLGGIPSSFSAESCDMIIVDRSFSSMQVMAGYYMNFGPMASYCFRIGSCGW
jgi:alpha/beta superfamily hydrolase